MAAFATPVGTDNGRQTGSVGLGVVQAADEVTSDVRTLLWGQRVGDLTGGERLRLGSLERGALGLWGLGLGGIAQGARLDQAVSLGEVAGGGIGGDGGQFAQFLSSVAAVSGRKRGGAPANCPCA